MKVKTEQYDVGVIVARFQVAELHPAHVDLIESVCAQHGKVLLFLGLSEVKSTRNNPLDFEARKQMVNEVFPDVLTLYIKNEPTNEGWSQHLDELVQDQLTPSQSAVLYGSRDSFLPAYSGRFPTRELDQEVWVSGTELRKHNASKSAKASVDWRRGAMWAAFNRYPTPFPTVDVALFNDDRSKVLLAKRRNESLYRYVGGFVQPGESLEQAVSREAREETGLEISPAVYIRSLPVDDWRYRDEEDGIVTSFFVCQVIFGSPKPGDDLAGGELRWFVVDDLEEGMVVVSHRPLRTAMIDWLSERKHTARAAAFEKAGTTE